MKLMSQATQPIHIIASLSLSVLLCCSQSGGFLELADGSAINIDDTQDGSTNTSSTGVDGGPPPPPPPVNAEMSFFVTSRRVEIDGQPVAGGNLGGLAGADAFCQLLAREALPADTKTWRAYLSTSSVNARDRIGAGPWRNYEGNIIANNVDELHTNPPSYGSMFTETGALVRELGLRHDIITGSKRDGRRFTSLGEMQTGHNNPTGSLFTFPDNSFTYRNPAFDFSCNNWTTNAGGENSSNYAVVGHVDWNNLTADTGSDQWTTSHVSACDLNQMNANGGDILIYCFASN